jgi:hypothetical protein
VTLRTLGHSLSAAGVTPGPDKCKALRALTPPTSPKQLRSFLGMVNYFRSYVPAFATRAAPLYRLTRPNSPWKGGVMPADAVAAFEAIRQAVVEATTRRFPCPRRAFHLYVDAAVGNDAHDGGLGACLMQPDASGAMAPVAFASRQLKPHEKNYSAFLLEKQAAVFAIEHFEQHLKGRHFYLYTDHKPLVRMSAMQTKTLNRLQTLLLEHSFTIRHVAGKDNPVADYLSRNADQAEPASAPSTSRPRTFWRPRRPTRSSVGPWSNAAARGRHFRRGRRTRGACAWITRAVSCASSPRTRARKRPCASSSPGSCATRSCVRAPVGARRPPGRRTHRGSHPPGLLVAQHGGGRQPHGEALLHVPADDEQLRRPSRGAHADPAAAPAQRTHPHRPHGAPQD